MNAPEGAKERLISNYCEELEKTLEDVHCNIASKINIAQRRQKKGYDDRNGVDETLAFEPGDRVWLHHSAVGKGLSRKFHHQWIGPYVILNRLGRVNYHIKPEIGKGRAKVVHLNRLKSVKGKQGEDEETVNDNPDSLLTKANPPTNEPAIHHNEEVQPPPEEKTTPLRRSTRCRRPPDRYQDFNLEDIQIEDALI